jgi:uncharacterized protein YkwD
MVEWVVMSISRASFATALVAVICVATAVFAPVGNPANAGGTAVPFYSVETTATPIAKRCTMPANAAAMVARVIGGVNAQRRASGLATLRTSPALMQVAQGHACDNAARGGYSHTGSDGSDLKTRLRRGGYRLRVATENTAYGFDDPNRLVGFWMESSGHRANILNPGTVEIGLGLATGARPAWVLVMARRM